MPFLRIGSIDIEVDADTASQVESRQVGTVTASFSGKLRNSVQRLFREWQMDSAPVRQNVAEAILNQFQNGAFAIVSGDMLGTAGGARQCHIVASEIPYVHDGSTGFYRVVRLRIRETTGDPV